MRLSRREVLGMSLAIVVVGTGPEVLAQGTDPEVGSLSSWMRAGIQRDTNGTVVRIFGIDVDLASDVLMRATRADAVRDGYAPDDLVSAGAYGLPSSGRQLLRAIVVDDTRALIEEAAAEGHQLLVGSGFRSQMQQAEIFAAQVRRWGDEDMANRYSARAGYSQHQLGTAVDFTTTFGAFRRSPAAEWVRDTAHRFGFVLPYTAAAAARTGYVDEPWHARWVGPALATRMHSAGYQHWTTFDADDLIALVRAEAQLDSPQAG